MNTEPTWHQERPTASVNSMHRDFEILARGNNAFACDLYQRLRKQEGNLFFSPVSISSALAMTYAGAREKTAREMFETLHFPMADQHLHEVFGSLLSDLQTRALDSENHLFIANALWGQKGLGLIEAYLKLIERTYGASLTELDFLKNCESARQTVNAWAEEKTKGNIKDLIPSKKLTPATKLVLTNATYFYGKWALPFNEGLTHIASFNLRKGFFSTKKVKVPFMLQTEYFRHLFTGTFQAIQLPYLGGELNMLILLPYDIDGLGDLEKQLTAENLDACLDEMEEIEMRVYIPKFRLEYGVELPKMLMEMGMVEAFELNADFSGMANNREGLMISEVIHKANVDVAEQGTEATAATAVTMTFSGAYKPKRIPIFRADHPFIFLIRDTRTESILFLGRVVDPTSP